MGTQRCYSLYSDKEVWKLRRGSLNFLTRIVATRRWGGGV
jgi:hypothetical protein